MPLGLGFTNLDIDPRTGVIYFTDSSSVYQRRNRGDYEWSKPGRLMTQQLTTLLSNLVFANGVVGSKNGDYFLVVETTTCRILRYWLNATSIMSKSRENNVIFAERPLAFPTT
ncbi:unnamed protein product [Arabidopsis lyrata]|uniref:Strictosidine synthase conserved region domain-containing protein n=1 Tax=Arabidopsis lyrata subsp. lyrata TaxID=81972 RepID=D7LGK9_ARALL|nr:hypothetical protein ARALYDRAFT_345919 [Arabidopsis lyrata subsp. lyrata]CAH8265539.1 unnamed protein product [Arabidopsis lyrata]